MFGAAVTSCHIRVPVSSNPKYSSVSRFSRTDSRSTKRTRTWAGVAARSVNETIGSAPPGEPGTKKQSRTWLRLLLLQINFRLDACAERLQVRQSLLCLLTPRPVWIELLSLLIRFHRARCKLNFFSIPDLLRGHPHQERGAQQVPSLSTLRIKLRRFLQRLDRICEAIRVVQTDPKVAPCGRGIRRVQFRAFCI